MLKNFFVKFFSLFGLMIFIEINIFISILSHYQYLIFYGIHIVLVVFNRIRHLQYNLAVSKMRMFFELINHEIQNEEDLEEKLRQLMFIYDILYEASVNINDCFGWSNVCNIYDNFVQILVDFYWFYWKQSINDPHYVYEFGGHFLDYVFRISPTVIIILIILDTNKKCMFESQCFGSNIHRIAMRYDEPDFIARIKCYSLQILHEKIQFTAKDMIPITLESVRTVRL